MRESFEAYVYDLSDEEVEELCEEYDIDNDRDELIEYFVEDEDSIEWYKNNFGESEFFDVAKDEIDIDKLINLLMEDAEYWSLAGYDHHEHEVYIGCETYFVYRQN